MNFQNKKTMPRYSLVTLILTLAGVCAVAKSVYTMTVDREHCLDMKKLLVKEGRSLPAKRGNILSADGQILASSLPEYQIFIDYMSCESDSAMRAKDQHRRDSLLRKFADTVSLCMHELFPDIIPEKFKEHLLKGREKESRYWPVYVKEVTTLPLKRKQNRQITYIEYSKVKQLPFFSLKSSINYVKIDMRKRPFGSLAQRTVGYFKDTARYGLELSFDSILAGKPGKFHYQKVMNHKMPVVDVPAEDGCDIQTTLDVNMQQICEKALGDKLKEINAESGVCILMETATGDIKAMSSLSRRTDGSYHEDAALAVTDLYEPGSVFKPQSFLVAFDDGKIKMTDYVDVDGGIYNFGGSKMKDHNWRSGGYGRLTVPQIIGNSSNVGVSVLIDRHYSDNPRSFVDGLYRIGSAENLQIPIPGYQPPRIRRPGEGAYWSRTTLPWMSIGYETQITPINTLNFYNGIANNGRMVRPRLVKAVLRDGKVVKEYPVVVLREHMASAEAVQNVRECLEYVVTRGVGKAAGSKKFTVAGKTGTAQIWSGKGRTSLYFITFAGYFPADKPQYSCIVCIRKPAPASGGGMCGPVFRRVAESVMARNHMDDYSSARDTLHAAAPTLCSGDISATSRLFSQMGLRSGNAVEEGEGNVWGAADCEQGSVSFSRVEDASDRMPDVVGYGLRDAVCRLEEKGLKVKAHGVGKVISQDIKPGTDLKSFTTVTLTLGYEKGKASKTATAAKPKAEPATAAPQTEKKPGHAAGSDTVRKNNASAAHHKQPAAKKKQSSATAAVSQKNKKKKS